MVDAASVRGATVGEISLQQTITDSSSGLLSRADAASFLKIGETKLDELLAKRRISSVKIGRRRLVPVAALHRFVGLLLEESAE